MRLALPEVSITGVSSACSTERSNNTAFSASIGEDASEKFDYTSRVFDVERHIRGE